METAAAYEAGCQALSLELQRVSWPARFHPDVPKYDGDQDPIKFVQLYTTAVHATGRVEKVMANWFPLVLIESRSPGS